MKKSSLQDFIAAQTVKAAGGLFDSTRIHLLYFPESETRGKLTGIRVGNWPVFDAKGKLYQIKDAYIDSLHVGTISRFPFNVHVTMEFPLDVVADVWELGPRWLPAIDRFEGQQGIIELTEHLTVTTQAPFTRGIHGEIVVTSPISGRKTFYGTVPHIHSMDSLAFDAREIGNAYIDKVASCFEGELTTLPPEYVLESVSWNVYQFTISATGTWRRNEHESKEVIE